MVRIDSPSVITSIYGELLWDACLYSSEISLTQFWSLASGHLVGLFQFFQNLSLPESAEIKL